MRVPLGASKTQASRSALSAPRLPRTRPIGAVRTSRNARKIVRDLSRRHDKLEELSRDDRGRRKVVKVNLEDNPSTARRFQGFAIPTIQLLRGGQTVDRIVGALPKEQLVAKVAAHLAPTALPMRPTGS